MYVEAGGEPLGHLPENWRGLLSGPDLDGHTVGAEQSFVGSVRLEQRCYMVRPDAVAEVIRPFLQGLPYEQARDA